MLRETYPNEISCKAYIMLNTDKVKKKKIWNF